jgi:monosaccharide-transporting ATPase
LTPASLPQRHTIPTRGAAEAPGGALFAPCTASATHLKETAMQTVREGYEYLLQMEHICKKFSGIAALSDASLRVKPAEVHALIGQNGAGKSTMIKILTGAYLRDSGDITFNGATANFTTPQRARAAGISTIYQEVNLVPFRSIAENIFLGREPRRFGLIDWKQAQAEATRLLAGFGIEIDVRKPVMDCSTATQQMVAMARAVSVDAKLLILDESTSSLDDREAERLFGVIRQLKAEGRSIIFVSHRLDELYAVCDHVTVMRDGRTVADSPMRDITKMDLITTMLGRALEKVILPAVQSHAEAHVEAQAAAIAAPFLDIEGVSAPPKVRDATLSVRRGEKVGLAGLLGAGRTELMRALFGADPSRRRAMRIDGVEVDLRAPLDAIRAGIAYLPEDRKAEGIIPGMSVRENLSLVLYPALSRRGVIDRKQQDEVVQRFIRRLGIKIASPDQPIRELSGGNQQKVLLARWLCTNPKLLLLDEPTRGIDVGAKAEILGLINELALDGMAVLMTASELEELVAAADRVVVMSDGSTTHQLTGDQISEAAIMTAMAHDPA